MNALVSHVIEAPIANSAHLALTFRSFALAVSGSLVQALLD